MMNDIAAPPAPSAFMTMGDIACQGPVLRPDALGERLFELFHNDPALMLVAVVDEHDAPVGLVERQAFFLKVSGRFGHALFNRRPVALLMDDRPVMIDANIASAEFTARALMTQPSDLMRGYIVTKAGRYHGTGSALDLINASHSHAVASASGLKAAAEDLRRANKRILRDKLFIDTIVENIPSALIVRSTRDDHPVLVNRAAEEMMVARATCCLSARSMMYSMLTRSATCCSAARQGASRRRSRFCATTMARRAPLPPAMSPLPMSVAAHGGRCAWPMT